MASCSIGICDRPAVTRGWCQAHYLRWRTTGDVRPDIPIGGQPKPTTCRLDDCDRIYYSRGLCEMHYRRQRRTGSPHREAQPVHCSIEGCDEPVDARGWCHGHHQRWLRTGDVEADVPLGRQRQSLTCIARGCGRPTKAQNLCNTHYQRTKKHGSPLEQLAIRQRHVPTKCRVDDCPNPPCIRGRCLSHFTSLVAENGSPLADADVPPVTCSIDDCDRRLHTRGLCHTHYTRHRDVGDAPPAAESVKRTGQGYVHHGYWMVPVLTELRHLTGGETTCAEHRLVMAMSLGRALYPDELVHHLNGDRLDNRPQNLELWSTYQPRGQRVEDKVIYAIEMLKRYTPNQFGVLPYRGTPDPI